MFLLARRTEAVVAGIFPESIAEEVGLEAGDKIIKINGQALEDQLDFRFLQADENLEIEVEKSNGEIWILDIEKDMDEDLGIQFEDATFNGIKPCCNKCLFCFVDQMPKELRSTLYVKDDDYRHSFLFGNFITLTNLTKKDMEKIIRLKLSPLYVSIHTTNPELRKKLLNNRNAEKIFEQLKYLTGNGITIHGQIVLVPEFNDGDELRKTIEDLATLIPKIQSLAVVPVGLTKFREDLPSIKTFTKEQAALVLDLISQYQKEFLNQFGTRFVFAADEFYVLADREIPNNEFYEGFPQTENGIGIIRLMLDEFNSMLSLLPEKIEELEPRLLLTSVSGYKVIWPLVKRIKDKYNNLSVELIPVINDFFGSTVTVTGLLTGQDIIKAIKQAQPQKNTTVVIPDIMLKDGWIFLDDLTLDDVQKQTGLIVKAVSTSGKGLIEGVTNLVID